MLKLFGLGKRHYTADDILQQLDSCANDFTFPMLDNGYVYPIDSRLSAYRDKKRWVLLIEVLGFSYRGGGHDGINNCLHIFGNCLPFEPGTANANFLYMTDNSEEGETFEEEYLNIHVQTMLLRDQKIKIPLDIAYYIQKGIVMEEPPRITIWEMLRAINDDYKIDFLATEDEIRQRIPADLPLILRLDEWCHNDLADREKPSQHQTFQMIAKVLETGNTKYYQPTLAPNNHWKHWPEGGTL